MESARWWVTVKRIDKPCIALASTDSGAYDEFTETGRLQNCRDPFDTYALHKAALLACGIVPLSGEVPLEKILEKLGGGLYLSTAVMGIPQGLWSWHQQHPCRGLREGHLPVYRKRSDGK